MANLKTEAEIEIMAEGGKILARVRDRLAIEAKEGITLRKLDELAEKLIREAGAVPAFLGYRPGGAEKPYPSSICASVNEVIVHGLPTNYKLKSGDVLKIDLGVLYKSFYTDTAITVGIGQISPEAKKLISTTKKALELAIENCQLGKTLGDIGFIINKYTRSQGFKVVKGLTGHGVGKRLHEEPTVFNEGREGTGPKLVPGMVLAIEPMLSAGDPEIVQLEDESYATRDGSLSAQFEHTVAITENGPYILTR